MNKPFPWVQDYYTARVFLGFSELEFWQSSPRKIYALKAFRDKVVAGATRPKPALQEAMEIKSLLGLA